MKESIHTVENFGPQKSSRIGPAVAGPILLPEPASITYSFKAKFPN
jgi:hypothetical protein